MKRKEVIFLSTPTTVSNSVYGWNPMHWKKEGFQDFIFYKVV